ncbi:Hypothetical protein AJAP_27865 [Amycolatopsis japonica]|uniref:Polynucleotide kinase PNKP phosphatase domain-containing protein n=1 Tax=Amycolatopsis japonica TaxID=208439 RepID=A0A075UW70_9PSEU|nr:AAA family ATPase [Amycolatopsis japonica]AIG78417.1 Hypothetical protein AJAP_27865 [Amycolatopsis japonica]
MPGTLHILRGLPGVGKTTRARRLRKRYGGVLAGRDHFRALYGTEGQPGDRVIEDQITQLQVHLITHALSVGDHVYVDDMNLRDRYVRRLLQIARQQGAEVAVYDLTDHSVELAIVQDANPDRTHSVGEDRIRDLHRRFIKGRGYPLPMPELPDEAPTADRYDGDPTRPWAVLVDVDGTVAQMHDRSPYDMTRVGEDSPKWAVIHVVESLAKAGYRIVFVSARNEVARPATEDWIDEHIELPEGFVLHMRADGDGRDDRVVKREIFDKEIRDRYFVRAVLDDRDKVVRMWRDLGLTCLQVAEGAF